MSASLAQTRSRMGGAGAYSCLKVALGRLRDHPAVHPAAAPLPTPPASFSAYLSRSTITKTSWTVRRWTSSPSSPEPINITTRNLAMKDSPIA